MKQIVFATMLMVVVMLTGIVWVGTVPVAHSSGPDKKDASIASAIPKTPQGIECHKGVIRLHARSNTEFVLDDETVTRKQLTKTLRKARKASPFDCVVINGGHPTSEVLVKLAGELSRIDVGHVEWSCSLPTD